jgi:hypothetical protein
MASKTTPGETKARALAFPAADAVGAFDGLRGIRNASVNKMIVRNRCCLQRKKFAAPINGYQKAPRLDI